METTILQTMKTFVKGQFADYIEGSKVEPLNRIDRVKRILCFDMQGIDKLFGISF